MIADTQNLMSDCGQQVTEVVCNFHFEVREASMCSWLECQDSPWCLEELRFALALPANGVGAGEARYRVVYQVHTCRLCCNSQATKASMSCKAEATLYMFTNCKPCLARTRSIMSREQKLAFWFFFVMLPSSQLHVLRAQSRCRN